MAKKWTEERLNLVKSLLREGNTNSEIANIVGNVYKEKVNPKQIEKVIYNYGLSEFRKPKKQIEVEDDDVVFVKTGRKQPITKKQVDELCKQVGAKIYNSYERVKLIEPKVKTDNKRKPEEISILDLSDVHMGMENEVYDAESGKKVITYNHDICLKQVDILKKSIHEIYNIQSKTFKLDKLVIFCLGDIITNDRIFPEQTFEIEKCVGLQIWDAVAIWAKFFNDMLELYNKVEVVCVVGNHGRSNPTHYNEPIENNFEYFIYRTWQKQFEDSKRIKIIVPNTGRYIHQVGRWRHLVEHGHELRGYSETAIKNQLKELFINMGQFDVMHFGHIHQLADKRISDKVLVKQNGCWILRDEYAFKKFKTYSIPEQHFFGCNDNRKETWKYCIDLRG